MVLLFVVIVIGFGDDMELCLDECFVRCASDV